MAKWTSSRSSKVLDGKKNRMRLTVLFVFGMLTGPEPKKDRGQILAVEAGELWSDCCF